MGQMHDRGPDVGSTSATSSPGCWLATPTSLTCRATGVVAANHQMLADVVAELEAYRRGRPSMIDQHGALPGGGWVLCGGEDESCWNAAYVRADSAVLPLAAGSRDPVRQELARILDDRIAVWDVNRVPLPTIQVDGAAYHFTAAYGRRLLGVVQCKRGAVVLAALGREIAVIDVVGRRRSILYVGPPCSFRQINVDEWRRLERLGRSHADPAAPRQLSAWIEAEHRRIVHGLGIDVEGSPSTDEVLRVSFEDVAGRALALDRPADKELKGQTRVVYVARYFGKMAARGMGNLAGRISELHAVIQREFPEFSIGLDLFADVLDLFEATGTCVVPRRRRHQRLRRLNFEGLSDPHSRAHRRLCRETRSRHPATTATTQRGDAAGAAASAATASATSPPSHGDPSAPSTSPAASQGTSPAEVSAIFRSAAAAMVDAAAAPGRAQTENALTLTAVATAPNDPTSVGQPITASGTAGVDAVTVPGDVTAEPSAPTPAQDLNGAPQAAGPLAAPSAQTYEARFFDAIKRVGELGPAAGQTLLFGIRMGLSRIGDASDQSADEEAADPQTRRDADPGEGRQPAEPARPTARSRRRLHLSPDHFFELPIVASAMKGPGKFELAPDRENRAHDQVLGRTRSVGDAPGILGPRGPPG